MRGKDEEVDTGPHHSYVLRDAQAHLLSSMGRREGEEQRGALT